MIRLERMSKYYGSYPAVIDVSFEVLKGEIVGFLGPNGAGKTTTMRVLTGFTPPTHGTVTVAGFDVVSHSLDVRRHIGYLPETVPLYLDMTVTDYLEYMGRLRAMSPAWVRERLPKVIDMVRLGDYRDTLVGKLSKGYRQRTGIAQAILHEPDVLIMDEPTIGIDPVQVVETRELIRELGQEHTLLLSSHILPEVSMICKRVLVIHDGRIVADDTPSKLSDKLQHTERIELVVRGAQARDVISLMRGIPNVVDARSDARTEAQGKGPEKDGRVALIVDTKPNMGAAEKIAAAVVEKGWGLSALHPMPMTLEEIFLELTTTEEETEARP
jgi:ABC-2 type transport system ATP-binding protein